MHSSECNFILIANGDSQETPNLKQCGLVYKINNNALG